MKLGVHAGNGVLTNNLVWHIILLKVRNNGVPLCIPIHPVLKKLRLRLP